MKLESSTGESAHLTYCSNIHPGESWPEVSAALAEHVPQIRKELGFDGAFGLGLRLSAVAAEAAQCLRSFRSRDLCVVRASPNVARALTLGVRRERASLDTRTLAFPMNLNIALRLGRTSNLPTVWTNVLAAAALSGGTLAPRPLVFAALAASALYVEGTFLNDPFDAENDAQERPEGPIPAGEVSRTTVWGWGYGLLALGC